MNAKHTFARRLFAGLAAAATLLAGGVFASSASAADEAGTPYDATDDWEPAPVDNNHKPTLSVTKYESTIPPTGSQNDVTGSHNPGNLITANDQPESGVIFELYRIKPKAGKTYDDFNHVTDLATSGLWDPDKTAYDAYGITGANGKVSGWFTEDGTTGKPSTTPNPIKAGHHYYVLHQVNQPDTKYDKAEDSAFDLPYGAFNTPSGKTEPEFGYVYNLSVFPKNVNNENLKKNLDQVTTSGGITVENPPAVQSGDTAKYTIDFAFAGVTGNSDTTKTYLSDSNNDNASGHSIRIVDRLSSAFGSPNRYSAHLDWEGGTYDLGTLTTSNASTSWYTETSVTAGNNAHTDSGWNSAITRIAPGHQNDLIFGDDTSENDPGYVHANSAHYAVWDFFNKPNIVSESKIPENAKNVRLVITLTVPITEQGNEMGQDPNWLTNDVASDTKHGQQGSGQSKTATAGFQFGKTNNATKEADVKLLDGAVFRLQNPDNNKEYLGEDGQWHSNDSTYKHFVQATSRGGIVTFTALPLFDVTTNNDGTHTYKFRNRSESDTTGEQNSDRLTFKVVETQAPTGYVVPKTNNGWTVTYESHHGEEITRSTNEKHFLPDAPINFGNYQLKLTDAPDYTITNFDNHPISQILTNSNYQRFNLPLTGGMGIVLLLVIGAVIMAIVIIERKRREANARR